MLCELLCLHSKRKNNHIKTLERRVLCVLDKELKLFNHEFFFKQIRMTPAKLLKPAYEGT